MSLHLERELDSVKRKLLNISYLVEQNLSKSIKALHDKDERLAIEVLSNDRTIDLKEVEVEEDCLKILALQQPVAIDLRFVIATLKINNDLERIGDLACNIARRARFLIEKYNTETPYDYVLLADKTKIMVSDAIEALINMDLKLCNKVLSSDDEIDDLNHDAYAKVFKSIKRNPENVEAMIHYLIISKNLERIADYATNIAEDVIYMVEGRIIRHGLEGINSDSSLEI